MRLLALALVLTTYSAACAAEVDQIELPYPEALSCFGINKVIKVDQYMASHEGSRYFVMQIDTNEDGKKDGLLLYRVYLKDGDMYVAITPSYVVLDDDFDGHPDRAYYVPASEEFACDLLEKVSLETILQNHKGV